MHSSISPSDPPVTRVFGALPPGLRLTASDRPGQAQPVPVRDVPALPWTRMAPIVGALIVALAGAWEWQMRTNVGLRSGDLDDSTQSWAEQRRAVRPDSTVIVGDSRILFDTDLARFEQLTGTRPVQLAVVGTSARGLLQHMAADENFRGLLIVGMADTMFFRPRTGYGSKYIKAAYENGQPSQRSGLFLDQHLQNNLAFMDQAYRLSWLAHRLDTGFRKGVDGPYSDVWKISETFPGRQYFMWDRIERDPYLQKQARLAWDGFKGKPIPPALADKVVARTRYAVDKIRARGGDVVFVRPPSAPELRVNEDKRLPRQRGWERVLADTRSKGVHADDLPHVQQLNLPEYSHLSRACATVFTDAYVRRLTQLTPRLKMKSDAPRALTRADCVPVTMAGAR
jgi:hypothetical protein